MSDHAKMRPALDGIKIKSPSGAERHYAAGSFSVGKAGPLLGLSRSGTFKAVAEHRIPTIETPGGRRITAEAIDRHLYPDEWANAPEPDDEPEFSGEVTASDEAPVYMPKTEPVDDWGLRRQQVCREEAEVQRQRDERFLQYDRPGKRRPPRRRQISAGEPVELRSGSGVYIQPEVVVMTEAEWEAQERENRTNQHGAWVGEPIYFNGPNFL